MSILSEKSASISFINILGLILLNIFLMSAIGFFTLEVNANMNSRLAGLLLSLLIPYCITTLSPNISGAKRVLYFGSGFIFYIIFTAFLLRPFIAGFTTGLIPLLILNLVLLYFGNTFFQVGRGTT